jgi:hypothetical protein
LFASKLGAKQVHRQELHNRIDQLDKRTRTLEGRARFWKGATLATALITGVVFTSAVEASKARKELVLTDANTGAEALITPDGITFSRQGDPLLKLNANDDWTGITVYGSKSHPATFLGVDNGISMMKLYSVKSQHLLVETSESLLDAGSGIRLYDKNGAPRATLYAERRGEAGVEFTDANRQPRIDIYTKPDGVSVIRASDSSASAVAELSVLPHSDAMMRYTGFVVEPTENEPLIPMMFLHDNSGNRVLAAPGFSN